MGKSNDFILKLNQQKRKFNIFKIKDDCVEIATRHGIICVDICDYELVKNYYWDVYNGYAQTQIKTPDCKKCRRKRLFLHRLILGQPENGFEIDHIDRNKLNNRRSNLRFVSHFDNMQNREIPENNTSGFKNVSFDKNKNKFIGYFTYNSKRYYAGAYKTASDANDAVLKLKSKIIEEEL